jgi:hypothetical protein
MRPVATMKLRLLEFIGKRASYVDRTVHRTTDWTFLSGRQAGIRAGQPEGSSLCDAVVFANRGPKSSLRRSRRARKSSEAASGVAIPQPHFDGRPGRAIIGEAHVIQDELQNTYQRLPGP